MEIQKIRDQITELKRKFGDLIAAELESLELTLHKIEEKLEAEENPDDLEIPSEYGDVDDEASVYSTDRGRIKMTNSEYLSTYLH